MVHGRPIKIGITTFKKVKETQKEREKTPEFILYWLTCDIGKESDKNSPTTTKWTYWAEQPGVG